MAQVQSFLQLKMAISGNSKWRTMEKIPLSMYEKCNFPSHNEYLEIDGVVSTHEKGNISEWVA